MSTETNLSPIEMKRNESSDTNKNSIKDIKSFAKSVFMNFIYSILFGIVGSSVLYCSLIPETLFAINENGLPYTSTGNANGSNSGGGKGNLGTFSDIFKKAMKGGSGTKFCGISDEDIQESKKIIDEVFEKTGSKKFGFPYNLIKPDVDGIIQIFKNLIGESSKYSYVTCRKLITGSLKMFEGSENWLFILSAPVLWGLLVFFVPFFLGSFLAYVSYVGEYFNLMHTKYGWMFTIIFTLILGILFIFLGLSWSGMIGFTQMLRLYGTFLFLPIIKDTKHVLKIFTCKSHLIISLFVLLTIYSSIAYLDIIPAIVTSIVLMGLAYTSISSMK